MGTIMTIPAAAGRRGCGLGSKLSVKVAVNMLYGLDGIYHKPVDRVVTGQSCPILHSVIKCAELLAF